MPMNEARESDETSIPPEVLAEMEEEVDGWAREWGAVLTKAMRKGRPQPEKAS